MDAHLGPGEPSRHKCLIYDGDPSEQLPVVVPLLMDGLKDNWRCMYLGSPEAVQMVSSALAHRGVSTEREAERGALVFSSDRDHLVGGVFDPRAMVDGLCASIDDALRDGFEGLCATGDMKWELGEDENFNVLLEYEARLERVFREKPLRGICQYRRDILPGTAVRDALQTHRSAYVGDVLNRDNLFYIPPELLFDLREGAHASRHGDWMCRQILRVLESEHVRDRALAEQKRLADQLAAMNRDLERRVAERTAELEVANRHLEAFSWSVSHDLRAPLRSIRGFGEVLAEDYAGALGEAGLEHVGRIVAGARRMEQLIDGLLAMGRLASAPMDRVTVDLTAAADDVVRELSEAEPQRSVEIVVERGMRVVGDAVLLRAVLTNLVSNAWKFTARCARARVEVGRGGEEDGFPVFFVRDNGAGFDPKYAQKLFGVFQRLHREDDYPGTGVGLATVERIVSRHGGRIWAVGRPGEGATFYFTLPSDTPG